MDRKVNVSQESKIARESAFVAAHARACAANWPAALPRDAHYPFGEIGLPEYLKRWASLQPDKPAVIFYGRATTYRELDQQSDRFAALLALRGIRSGDRVAVFLPNCPQFMVAFYGILKLGAVHVPVNPMYTAEELGHVLIETQASAIVMLDQLHPILARSRGAGRLKVVLTTNQSELLPESPPIPFPDALAHPKSTPHGALDFFLALAATDAPSAQFESDLNAPAAINFTGGTTGLPKGCVHTQGDMLYTASTGVTFALRLNRTSVTLCFFPVFWMSGQNSALIIPIFSGGTVVLLAKWDPSAFMAAVQTYGVTHAKSLVDNVVELLGNPLRKEFNLRSLEYIHCVSFVKKLDPAVRAKWLDLTGSVLAESGWGMTETQSHDTFTTHMQQDDMDLRSGAGFVGLPVPGTEFKICDPETGELKDFNEEGEICVRSPSVFKGYWKGDAAGLRSPLRDGWFHSGDIGLISPKGYLYFRGRRKEMLKVRGMSVFPGEIEAAIGQHPATRACAVIGLEDPATGQRPVAFVCLREDFHPRPGIQEFSEWCRSRLAKYKMPEIRIVPSLPMTQTGKVRKEELKRLVSQEESAS